MTCWPDIGDGAMALDQALLLALEALEAQEDTERAAGRQEAAGTLSRARVTLERLSRAERARAARLERA